MNKTNILIGSHVSFAKVNPHNKKQYLLGALAEALEYGANAFMIYTGPPQSTYRVSTNNYDLDQYIISSKKHQFNAKNIVVHAAYIFNCATPIEEKRIFAVNFLISELQRAEFLGASILVLHPGNSLKSSTNEGIYKCALTISEAFERSGTTKIKIAIETMAGKGTEIGFTFEQLRDIMNNILLKWRHRVGVCLDTCHIYDAGYDIKNEFNKVMTDLSEKIGFKNVLLLHINDSKFGLNSHKDRHANIDKGQIMLPTLQKIVHFKPFAKVIKILETPWINGKPPYKLEILKLLNIDSRNTKL